MGRQITRLLLSVSVLKRCESQYISGNPLKLSMMDVKSKCMYVSLIALKTTEVAV